MSTVATSRICLLVGFSIALIASDSLARTWTVLPDGSGDASTIQAAVDSAQAGDIVELVDGVFTGHGNRDVDFHGKAITVRSASDDPEACTIECQGSFADPHRGFIFQSREESDSILRGVTITHGSTQETCPGCHGGGIYCTKNSSPTIENCTLRENVASTAGGGLYSDGGCSPTITACNFIDNTATSLTSSAGGMACNDGFDGTVADCVFSGNSAGSGGGLKCNENSPTFLRCLFTGNRSTAEGGAASCQYGSPAFIDCVFTENSCEAFGGALFFVMSDSPVVRGCTLFDNSGWLGAGIDIWETTISIENTIIAFNDEGTAIFCEGGDVATLTCCDLYGNQDGDWVGCIADQGGINGNLSSDPLFCDPPRGDLSLDASSVCLPENNECALLIGAYGQGCGPVSGTDDSGSRPMVWQNVKVHPNPFNPVVTISFELIRNEGAEVAVHDLSGRDVAVLANRTFSAGAHTLTWNGRDSQGRAMPSGTYIVRLKTEAGVEARKVMLVQ